MPGKLVSLSIKEGDLVIEGQEVAVVEAMKMQNSLTAPRSGKVKKVHFKVRSASDEGPFCVCARFPTGPLPTLASALHCCLLPLQEGETMDDGEIIIELETEGEESA